VVAAPGGRRRPAAAVARAATRPLPCFSGLNDRPPRPPRPGGDWRPNSAGPPGRGGGGRGEGYGRGDGGGRGRGRGDASGFGPPGPPARAAGFGPDRPPSRGPGAGRGSGRGRGVGGRGGFDARGAGFDARDKGRPRQSAAEKIEARRSARSNRKQARADAADVAVAEDIFEVGPDGMAVADLAAKLAIPPTAVVKSLFLKGVMVQVNQVLDLDMVRAVAGEHGADAVAADAVGVAHAAKKNGEFEFDDDAPEDMAPRPPVVTVMGHVDHGKTSLLDFVRNAKVAAGEAGGITQSIGAYTCDVGGAGAADGALRRVTFLDTPGHEAFSAMRARGARVTDIAVVIVAADDGVRPQTVEAVAHARAAGVPIIVAINKVDKEGADVERVKGELAEKAGLVPEEWGGDVPMVPISAKKGTGVDNLLETVALVAEMEQLCANPSRPAAGTVLEAHLDRRSGPTASVLVAVGTLRPGDVIVAGAAHGRVRSLVDASGELDAAGPSMAALVTGLNAVPAAGDGFRVCASEQDARRAAEAAQDAARLARLDDASSGSKITTMSLASLDDDEGGSGAEALQRVNVVLKADAAGAVEAVKSAATALPQDRVALRFLLAGPGDVTLSDVDLAFASSALILGFNVSPSDAVAAAAKRVGVDIRSYRVIYDLVDDLRAAMEGRLGAIDERIPIGSAAVQASFGSGGRKVAGVVVTDGALRKGALAVVTRKGKTVAEGAIASLRRVKDDVKEVTAGVECGVGVAGFNDWEAGDAIAAFDVVSKQRTLEEASEEVERLGAAVASAEPAAA